MIVIENSRDEKLINKLCKLFSCFKAEKYGGELFKNGVQYLIGFIDQEPIGICLLISNSNKTIEADIAIKKEWRGKIGYQFGKDLLKICRTFFHADNIIVCIDNKNKPSIHYCRHLGFITKCIADNDIILEYNYG